MGEMGLARYEFVRRLFCEKQFLMNYVQGDDSSEIKLDFTFDAELAKFAEEKSEMESREMHDTASPVAMTLGGVNTSSQNLTSKPPTSPAAQDLNMKIASVKNVWDSPAVPNVNNVFDQK